MKKKGFKLPTAYSILLIIVNLRKVGRIAWIKSGNAVI